MKALAKKSLTAMMLGAAALGSVTSPDRPGAAAHAAEAGTYVWNGSAIVKWPGPTLGNERTEVVYGSGTTVALNPDQAAAFGMNQFRYGQLRSYEQRGASIDRCRVTASLQK